MQGGTTLKLDHHRMQHLIQEDKNQTSLQELRTEMLKSKTCHQIVDKALETT